MSQTKLNRREFVKSAVTTGVAMGALTRAKASANVLGANDKIGIGMIGVGGRGRDLLDWAMKTGDMPNTPARVTEICRDFASTRVSR